MQLTSAEILMVWCSAIRRSGGEVSPLEGIFHSIGDEELEKTE
jgi:hypothetical protein